MTSDVLYRSFQVSARRYAGQIAIRDNGRDTSYRALEQASREVASGLIKLGLAHGERVAIWAVNSAEWILAGLGIQAAGGVLVPIGTRLRGREAGDILARAQVRFLFCDAAFGSFDFVAAVLDQDLPHLQAIIVLDQDRPDCARVVGLNALRAASGDVSAVELDARIAMTQADDLADIIFTSGTTGTPKGVPMTHSQSLFACRAQQQEMTLFTPDDVFPVTFPFAHNAGYRAGWQVSVLHGVRVIPVRTFDSGKLLEMIQAERVTFLPVAPPVAQAILDHPDQAEFDLSSVRTLATGGMTVPVLLIKALQARFQGTEIQTGYGLTETAGSVTLTRPTDDAETVAATVGSCLASLEVQCLDKAHRPVALGEIGEVAVRGPQVLHGYYQDPQATAAAFTAGGFLLTGDAGSFDDRGNLRLVDRIKDMYLVGGFNCYPAEIENMMGAMPGVAQVAVIGVEDRKLGQVGRAFVVRQPDATIDEETVIAWCRKEMANYKAPRSVRFLDALPTNATGKVAKTELRKLE